MAPRAGIYLRISSDPSGDRLGVTRQLKDCRARAAERGWDVVAVYEDNDVSASSSKPRPAYQRMLGDLEAGRIGAVVVWDLDRLTRRPIEVEQFIDLADGKGVALASVGGDVDLSTDNGRMYARIKGAVARAEIERKSARQKAANRQRAEAGRPHAGRRTFGYSPDGLDIVPEEAAEVVQAADALMAGVSIRGIAVSLNERGATTTAGNPWKPTQVRRILSNPRHAGIRVYNGVEMGDGAWPAVIDRETYAALLAILSDPSRHRAGRPRRHLLSGVATCSVCGGKIFGCTEKRGPVYMCETRRHVVRRAEDIESLVSDVLVERLSRLDAAELFASPGDDQRLADLVAEERALTTRKNGLSVSFAEGLIDKAQLVAGTGRLNAKLETARAEIASLARTPDMADLVKSHDVAATWASMDTDRKRTVIGLLLEVVLAPAGRGARVFDPEKVRLTWR